MLLTLGIEPDLKLAERLTFIQEDLGKIIESRHARVRWTRPEWLYFPIKFLGQIEESDVPEVCRLIESAVHKVKPFMISTAGLEAYPSAACPRIISVSMRQGVEALEELRETLEQSFMMSTLRMDNRPFKPQIMLGRISTPTEKVDLTDCMQAIGDLNFGYSEIREIVMYGADLLYSGAEYNVISRHNLG